SAASSAARVRTPSSLQAAAYRIRDVMPGARGRQRDRRAVLVDDVEERKPICYRDPGVAHPDKEIVLVLLLRLLRQLCALSSHAPCVVALGSHDFSFYCWPPDRS